MNYVYFKGLNWIVGTSILLQAISGITVAAVVKHGNSIQKNVQVSVFKVNS